MTGNFLASTVIRSSSTTTRTNSLQLLPVESSLQHSRQEECWVWVDRHHQQQQEQEHQAGMMISPDQSHLTTRHARDQDRWIPHMPSLLDFGNTLQVLDLVDCRYVSELHESVTQLPLLQKLRLKRCYLLETLPKDWTRLQALQEMEFIDAPLLRELPETLASLSSLERLVVTASSGQQNKVLTHLPNDMGTSLCEVVLDKCKALQALPASMGQLRQLKRLVLREAKALQELPETLGQCTNLVELNLLKCTRLQALPDSVAHLPLLEDLILTKCKSLTVLWPDHVVDDAVLFSLPHLATLDIRQCKNLQRLPARLPQACPRLHVVWATDCVHLTHLPADLVVPPQPQLDLWDFTGCTALEWPHDANNDANNDAATTTTTTTVPRQVLSPTKRPRPTDVEDDEESVPELKVHEMKLASTS